MRFIDDDGRMLLRFDLAEHDLFESQEGGRRRGRVTAVRRIERVDEIA